MSRLLGSAAAVLALVAAATYLLSSHDDRYSVRAEFRDAAGLRPHSAVKIGGVPVGTVADLRVVDHHLALAVLKVDRAVAPVGRDARAVIRPANLIGEKFVDLQPGDRSHPLPGGALITLRRTSTPIELDDLIDTLDAPTRIRLGILIRESGIAMTGRGRDFAALLQQMPPALDSSRRLVDAFADDNRALGQMVEASDRVVSRIAGERRAMGNLVDQTTGALETAASRRRNLGETVTRAPAALAQLRTTLHHLDAAGARLAPAARGLQRSAPSLAATLQAIPGFASAAVPMLATARTAAPSLDRLGREARPVVARLHPTATALASYASASDELSKTFDKGMPDFMAMMEGWARAIQTRDGLGHIFRTQVVLTDALVKSLLANYVRTPATTKRRRRHHSVAKPLRPTLPSVPGPHAPQPPRIPHLPVPKLPQVNTPPLPHPDERLSPVLDYLLGP